MVPYYYRKMPIPPKNSPGQVPTSSQRNKFATKRTLYITLIVVAIAVLVMFAPW